MATWLARGRLVDIVLGPFVDSTDGVTPETGLSIAQADVRVSKNGGAWAQKEDTTAPVHTENGWYTVTLDSQDTNTFGALTVAVYKSGALPVWREFLVVSVSTYESLVEEQYLLQVVAELNYDLVTFAVWGAPIVDYSGAAGSAAETVVQTHAKTAGLTYTVAGQVDANIQSVNETPVTGSGTGGDPWGP